MAEGKDLLAIITRYVYNRIKQKEILTKDGKRRYKGQDRKSCKTAPTESPAVRLVCRGKSSKMLSC